MTQGGECKCWALLGADTAPSPYLVASLSHLPHSPLLFLCAVRVLTGSVSLIQSTSKEKYIVVSIFSDLGVFIKTLGILAHKYMLIYDFFKKIVHEMIFFYAVEFSSGITLVVLS